MSLIIRAVTSFWKSASTATTAAAPYGVRICRSTNGCSRTYPCTLMPSAKRKILCDVPAFLLHSLLMRPNQIVHRSDVRVVNRVDLYRPTTRRAQQDTRTKL